MSKTAANAYLERPYSTVLIWDRETATYTAKIAEFSGCVTEGKTAGEALKRLKSAARSWIEAVLDSGQPVPEPVAEQEYSGRLLLRLPRSLHRRVAELAQADGISLNQFIATTLAERVGTGGARAGTTTNMLVFIAPQALPMPQPSLRTMNFQTLARKEIQLLRSAGTKEVVEALLKRTDIHEGLWALHVEFGLGALNAGPSEQDLKPSAIVPIVNLGIAKVDKPSNLTVDASVVNPARKRSAKIHRGNLRDRAAKT